MIELKCNEAQTLSDPKLDFQLTQEMLGMDLLDMILGCTILLEDFPQLGAVTTARRFFLPEGKLESK